MNQLSKTFMVFGSQPSTVSRVLLYISFEGNLSPSMPVEENPFIFFNPPPMAQDPPKWEFFDA